MAEALKNINTRNINSTPQSQKAHPKQTKNAAGGYTFKVTDEERLRRFLVLGTEGGTFYANENDITLDNAKVVLRMAKDEHETLVNTIVDVSLRGAAPKQNATLFALAVAASYGTDDEKRNALNALSKVARTGTHLFMFAEYVQQFRGWGRGLRRAVGGWYLDKDVDALAYQMVKYRQRGGWSHRDLLRLAHPSTQDPSRKALFEWATQGNVTDSTPRLVEAFLKAQEPGANYVKLIRDYRLSWEMLPDEALNDPKTWEALLDVGVPMTALIRQLPRLARIGITPAMGGRTADVVAQITDAEKLKKARVHPITLLNAMRTYSDGTSFRGTSTWTPQPKIVDALDSAFYLAFEAVEPANKRTLLALDVSGSMGSRYPGSPLTARDISVALAMVTAATEPETHTIGFTGGSWGWGSTTATPLDVSPKRSLNENIRKVSGLPFGGTDCALPFKYALDNKMEVDTVVVITDNETWAGSPHPYQALEIYRREMGIDTKLVALGVTATESSITNPDDAGSLAVVGWDTAVPKLISDFSRGL